MSRPSGILRYLAECYRENGSRFGLRHLGSRRVSRSLFLEGEDAVVSPSILDGQIYLPGPEAADLARQSQLYAKECGLFYGTVFLTGQLETADGSPQSLFAPLLLYQTSLNHLSEASGAEFIIDTSRCSLNHALLENLSHPDLAEELEQAIDAHGHSRGCVAALTEIFRQLLPDCGIDGLLSYPRLLPEKDLPASSPRPGSPLQLLSAACLFLVQRSTEMRGVLNDLIGMADSNEILSGPLRTIFGRDEPPVLSPSPPRATPALLSRAQEKISNSACHQPLTLAVGPPGTGKSFTIATLAMEAVGRGESVLICSKMDHAVDVVADKIEQTLNLPGLCVRAGKSSYLRELRRFLDDLLSGLHSGDVPQRSELQQSRRELDHLCRRIDRCEAHLEKRAARERARGLALADPSPGWLTRWRAKRWIKAAGQGPLLAALARELSFLLHQKIASSIAWLKQKRRYDLHHTLHDHRNTFQAFSQALRARSSLRQDEHFAKVDWTAFLHALPVWLVNLSDLHRVLPLRRELFDLVIIDEASQCDIASALPALQRAKRAVISGDPKQLRHVSFLSDARRNEFARQFGLSREENERFHFRDVSLLDLVSASIRRQERVVFLNEHFRSRPEIIRFSNEEFYAGRLAVLTGHRPIDRNPLPPLQLIPIAGRRLKTGVNPEEVDAIFNQLEPLTAPGSPPLSIGILSPFRAQVDAILSRLERSDSLPLLLQRHRLLVGTAHSFQGEERDIMLISLALDDDSAAASFRFLEKEDLFNVAITRARLQNRLFISFSFAGENAPRPADSLVNRYLSRFLKQPHAHAHQNSPPIGEETRGLISRLESAGIEVHVSFPFGHETLDLLCRRNSRALAIDLIGFPGQHAAPMTLDRHLMLERAGIGLFPVTYPEWFSHPEKILLALEKAWEGFHKT